MQLQCEGTSTLLQLLVQRPTTACLAWYCDSMIDDVLFDDLRCSRFPMIFQGFRRLISCRALPFTPLTFSRRSTNDLEPPRKLRLKPNATELIYYGIERASYNMLITHQSEKFPLLSISKWTFHFERMNHPVHNHLTLGDLAKNTPCDLLLLPTTHATTRFKQHTMITRNTPNNVVRSAFVFLLRFPFSNPHGNLTFYVAIAFFV